MTRFTPAAVVVALAAGPLAAQHGVVGPTGPGLQPQINGALYQTPQPTLAAGGVNPFAVPRLPAFPPPLRLPQRSGGVPGVVVPPAPAMNNPAAFNLGFVPQLPLLPGQQFGGLPPVGFNPLFVARPRTGSPVPPPGASSPGTIRTPSPDDRITPIGGTVLTPIVAGDAGPLPELVLRPGELRFLGWIW
mgnify:CR=1 FL=1